MADDARAMAQLELLYRLGVIQRDQPSDQTRYEEADPQFEASEVTADASCSEEDENETDFNSAVSKIHPMEATHRNTHTLWGSRRAPGSEDGVRRTYLQYPVWRSTDWTTRMPRSDPYDGTFSPRSTTAKNSTQEHPRQLGPSNSLRHEASNASNDKKGKNAAGGDSLRMYFLYWKLFLRSEREKSNLNAVRVFHVKKCSLEKWRRFIQYTRNVERQTSELVGWRARRAASKWRAWTRRHQQVQLLLENTRYSVVSQLRKRRIWTRWMRFSIQNRRWRALVEKRRRQRQRRLMQSTWHEFKAYMCRSSQNRQALRKCLEALRVYKDRMEAKRQKLLQNQLTLQRSSKRRLLARWRQFVASQRSTRRAQQRILFGISRKRYFRAWHDCFRETSFIAEFKSKQTARSLQLHFLAWYSTAKALQMARKKAFWTRKGLREKYFHKWRRETDFALRCQSAAQGFTCSRKASGLRKLHAWATARRRQRQIEGTWETRVLKEVWRKGFLAYHHLQQDKKTELRKLDILAQRSYFEAWRDFRTQQIRAHRLTRSAIAFARMHSYQKCLTHWKENRRRQLLRRERIAHAGEYHQNRLLRKGVEVLSDIVNQANRNAQRSHHIRRQMRVYMKARCFGGWKRWISDKQHDRNLLANFQTQNRYRRSWFNPCRRAWNQWRSFARSNVLERRMDKVYLIKLRHRVFTVWRRRAHVGSAVSKFQRELDVKTLEHAFSCWRSRSSHWQKVREVLALARAVYRRRSCAKVLREWSRCARKLTKLQMQSDHLDEMTKLNASGKWFRIWYAHFHRRNTFTQHRTDRQMRWKATCFRRWQQYIGQRVKLKRKFCYFRQVFGKHPTTSLLRRDWARWKRYARTSRTIHSLIRRQRRKTVHRWWTRWELFHFFRFTFREWNRVASQNAIENGRFGKRLRYFHKSRLRRLQVALFSQWKAFDKSRKSYREHLLCAKYQTLQEIVSRNSRHTRATTRYMQKWFSRWHKEVHRRSKAAARYYEERFLRKVLILWWRLMVNSKQELVVSEAKQVSGSMSFYHPKQQLCSEIAKEKLNTLNRSQTLRVSKPQSAARDVTMKTMRRMLDPEEKRKYSSAYRDPGRRERQVGMHGYDGGTRAKVEAVPRVRVPPCDRGLRETSGKENLYEQESRKKNVSRYSPSHRYASAPQRSRLDRNHGCEQPEVAKSLPSERSPRPVRDIGNPSGDPIDRRTVHFELDPDSSTSQHQEQKPDLAASRHEKPLLVEEEELPLFDDLETPSPEQHTSTSYSNHRQSRVAQEYEELPLLDTDVPQAAQFPAARDSGASTQAHQVQEAPRNRDHSPRVPERANCERGVLSPRVSNASPYAYKKATPAGRSAETSDDISLERLASMELYESSRHSLEKPTVANAVHPLSTVGPKPPHPAKEQMQRQQAKKPVVLNAASESLSLSAILDLPERLETRRREIATAAQSAPESIAESMDGSDILNEILDYYAGDLIGAIEEKENGGAKTKRKRMCFRILRDLGLFHNEFYFPQMEKIMDAIDIDHILIHHERAEIPLDHSDKQHLRQLEVEYLKRFLDTVLETHPLFERYYDSALKKKHLGHRFASSSSSIDLDTLRWLVKEHLQPWIRVKKSRPIPAKPFWVRSPLPKELVLAFDKLMLCVSKYFKVLTQLFSARPDAASKRGRRKSAELLTKEDFVSILKQAHVFPQLFHRREVESAFDAACCSTPDQKEINFPEFVEALLRCSSSLQWGESALNDQGATGVAVKFLMLIFAMEGKGSVLQKRNDDLQVVVGFLEQQQVKKKEAKMHRFRKLLVDQKQQHVRSSTGQRSRHPDRSLWKELESESDGYRSVSPHRGENSTLFYCGDSIDAISAVQSNRNSPDRNGFNLRLRESNSMDRLHSTDDLDLGELPCQSELVSPPDTAEQRGRHFPTSSGSGDIANRERMDLHQLPEAHPAGSHNAQNPASPVDLVVNGDALTQEDTSMNPAIDSAHDMENEVGATASSTYAVGELRDKNEFLHEILASISDVELVLQQSNRQLKHRPSLDPSLKQARAAQSACAEENYSDDFENESYDSLTSHIMLKLFTASNSTVHMESGKSDDQHLLDRVEDVQVNDPMLNQLTQIERFTDSSDWQAHPSLEDIAQHGIHAAFPSSLHTATAVEDFDLDALTDPMYRDSFIDAIGDDEALVSSPIIDTVETI